MLYYIYDNNEIIGLKYNNQTYFYKKNLQGDIIGLYNSNFEQIVTYTYDSWGKVISVTDTNGNEITDESNIALINPFRYRSYYYDNETELYYLNSRYYNPTWGRFINIDSLFNNNIKDYNLFVYSENNFINFSDIQGDSAVAVVVICAAVNAAVSFGIQVASNVATGEKWNKDIVGATIGGAVGGAMGATGSALGSSYMGSLVESVVNEVISYSPLSSLNATTKKKLTLDNFSQSATNILSDTFENGTISLFNSWVASKIVPINNGWFKPTTIKGSLFGKYGKRLHKQSFISGLFGFFISIDSEDNNKVPFDKPDIFYKPTFNYNIYH